MLNIKDIEKLLEENGCIDKHKVDKSIEYYFPDLKQFLYVNKEAGNNYSGLVIHPRYQSHRDTLIDISGVNSHSKYLHKSGMRAFPKKFNRGKKTIPYGIPFGFDDEIAFDNFLKKLTSISPAYIQDELDDVDEAEVKAEFTGLSATEKKTLINARLGHGKYRDDLIKLWECCSVTECSDADLLKASHIKPWSDSDNFERLDVYNGLLLIPNLDTAFDRGLITFKDDGAIKISSFLSLDAQDKLGINNFLKVLKIKKENISYLEYHRKHRFQE